MARAYEDASWPSSAKTPSREGPKATRSLDAHEVAVGGDLRTKGIPTGSFPSSDRLHTAAEFRSVLRSGRRVAQPEFVVLTSPTLAPDRPEGRRLGVTVSRRVGGAVVRNRLKRRIREWFRRNRTNLELGTDVVVVARRPAVNLSSDALAEVLNRGLGEVGS